MSNLRERLTTDQMRVLTEEMEKLFLHQGWPDSRGDAIAYFVSEIAREPYPFQAIMKGLGEARNMRIERPNIPDLHKEIKRCFEDRHPAPASGPAGCEKCDIPGFVSLVEEKSGDCYTFACCCSVGTERAMGMNIGQWNGNLPFEFRGKRYVAYRDWLNGRTACRGAA